MSKLLHAMMLVVMLGFAGVAQAVSVAPGGSAPLTGTTSAARPELAGTVLEDVLRPFSINLGSGNFITGTVQDRVVREDVSGTLDFYYRIFVDAPSAGSIGIATRQSYLGYSTDVDYRTDGLGTVGAGGVSRPTDPDVWFSFMTSLIGPGQESLFFFIKTDATAYNDQGKGSLVGLNSLGGFGVTSFSTFQPLVVPLPPALWLFGAGLLGLLGVARKKHRGA